MATPYRKQQVADLQATKGYQGDKASLDAQAERLAELKKYVGTQRGLSAVAKLLAAGGRAAQGRPVGNLSHLNAKIGMSDRERSAALAGLRGEKSALLKDIEGARQFKQDLAASVNKDRATQQAALLNTIGRITTEVAGNVTTAQGNKAKAKYDRAAFLQGTKKNLAFTRHPDQDTKTALAIQNAVDEAKIPKGSWGYDQSSKTYGSAEFWDKVEGAIFKTGLRTGDKNFVLEGIAEKLQTTPVELRRSLENDQHIALEADATQAVKLGKILDALKLEEEEVDKLRQQHADLDEEIEKEMAEGERLFIAGGVSPKLIKTIGEALLGVGGSGESGLSSEELAPLVSTINKEMSGLGDGDAISSERMKQIEQIEALELMYKNALGSRPIQEAFKLMEDSPSVAAIQEELRGKGYNLSKRDTVQLILRNRRMGLQLGRDATSLTGAPKRDASLLKKRVEGGENLADAPDKADALIDVETWQEGDSGTLPGLDLSEIPKDRDKGAGGDTGSMVLPPEEQSKLMSTVFGTDPMGKLQEKYKLDAQWPGLKRGDDDKPISSASLVNNAIPFTGPDPLKSSEDSSKLGELKESEYRAAAKKEEEYRAKEKEYMAKAKKFNLMLTGEDE